MKWVKRILVVLIILLIVFAVAIHFYLDSMIKTAVEKAGPVALDVPVTLESVSVALLKGDVYLNDLIIGNPEGFESPYLFKLGKLDLDIDTTTLASDTIVIKRIHIINPEISYEQGLTGNNISALLKNLEGEESAEEEPEEEAEVQKPEADEKPSKKIVIEDFLLAETRLKVSIKAAGGKQLSIPLPPIHLTDLGKESDGASPAELMDSVIGAISDAIGEALMNSADLLGDGAKFLGKSALQGADMAGDAAVAVGGAAADGAKAIGGTAADGAKAAGDTAVKGVKAIGSGAGKLFKSAADLVPGGEDQPEETPEE